MADDIVTDLRYCAKIHAGRVRHGCIAEAIEEIERLRAQVAELNDAKHWLNEDLLRMRSNFERAQTELEWVRRER